jgi:hypothetical protein
MKLKHSIGQLALAILGFGVAFRALTTPSALWGAIILSLALAICTLAAVGGFFARGPRQAAFGGAAICGWAYLFASLGPWAQEEVGPHLITSAAIDLLSTAIRGPSPTEKLLGLLKTRDELRLQMKLIVGTARNPQQDPAMQRMKGKYEVIQAALEKHGVPDDDAIEVDRVDRWAVWTEPDLFMSTTAEVSASPNFQWIAHGTFAFAGAAFGRFVARPAPAES